MAQNVQKTDRTTVGALARRKLKIIKIRNRRLKSRIQKNLFPTRLFQIFFSTAALFFLSPLFALVSLLVIINSPGPVFYRGARVGKDNTVFRLIKFRTLPVRYEERVGRRLLTEKERYSGIIANLIIRLKLDEIPQLINVIRGEMALVGPRPVRPVFYSKYSKEIPGYAKRFQVKPGITGLAQIIGGYYMAPEDKLKYDLLYVQNKSIAFDMKIIFLTTLTLMLSRNIMRSLVVGKFLKVHIDIEDKEIVPTKDVYDKVTDQG